MGVEAAESEPVGETVAEDMAAEEIDGAFVPRLRPEVASVQLDGEAVLLLEARYTFHRLDRLGTILLDCFDGTASLDELIADISEVFSAEIDVVSRDVLDVTREMGKAGLLQGVAAELPPPPHEPVLPQGLEVGTEVPSLSLPELGGGTMELEDLRGERFLLVNWSPGCGFCGRIAPELAELRPELERRGVRLVLLASGSAEDNRKLLDEHGLRCTVLLNGGPDVGLFGGAGTPTAYLIDQEGKTASSLAVGAALVPELARAAAGLGGDQ